VIAGTGRSNEVTTTAVFPDTIAGAITLVRPSRLDSCGASSATTPVASGKEKSKYGPATGLLDPSTWDRALRIDNPSAAATSALNWSCRPSITSAIR
jgi:hypothetical protein